MRETTGEQLQNTKIKGLLRQDLVAETQDNPYTRGRVAKFESALVICHFLSVSLPDLNVYG